MKAIFNLKDLQFALEARVQIEDEERFVEIMVMLYQNARDLNEIYQIGLLKKWEQSEFDF